MRVIALIPTVAHSWAMLKFAAALHDRHNLGDLLQLTVGVAGTSGALLGALGEGWAEPGHFQNTVGPCSDSNLLWHLELSAEALGADARDIAYRIGDRLEDAWGTQHRRYLAYRGSYAGKLDPRSLR